MSDFKPESVHLIKTYVLKTWPERLWYTSNIHFFISIYQDISFDLHKFLANFMNILLDKMSSVSLQLAASYNNFFCFNFFFNNRTTLCALLAYLSYVDRWNKKKYFKKKSSIVCFTFFIFLSLYDFIFHYVGPITRLCMAANRDKKHQWNHE